MIAPAQVQKLVGGIVGAHQAVILVQDDDRQRESFEGGFSQAQVADNQLLAVIHANPIHQQGALPLVDLGRLLKDAFFQVHRDKRGIVAEQGFRFAQEEVAAVVQAKMEAGQDLHLGLDIEVH